MVEELEQKIAITKSPYLIWENNKGEFHLVTDIILNCNETWYFGSSNDYILEEGLDIIECPNRDLSILVEVQMKNKILTVIDKLRDFAYVSNHDYFSYITPIINMTDGNLKVKPRIFRKYVND